MRADIRNELQGHLLAGRYRLDRVLAAGGMAEVWQATDIVLARKVAVKMLRPHLSADPAFVRRFRREALAAARLNHPGIVAIFDSCTDGDLEAIVMELVEGPTLRQRLDDSGPLDAHVAIGIGAQVAAALDAAHAAGIIHRDIKPANILLCRPDNSSEGQSAVPRLMVTDFGIAKALISDGEDPADQTDLTRAGAMLGTAKYLAPEQVQGGPVDARTDVYALGVVLYEALCGRPPFAAENDLATALARLNSEPLHPRQVRPDIRRDVEAVVLRAMAREPAQRYGSAAELRAALLAVDPGPSSQATALVDPTDPAPDDLPTFVQSERSWLVPTALIALLAAALVTTGVLLGRTDAGRNFVDRALEAVGARDSGTTTTTTAAEPRALGPLTAAAFDPEGDRTENDDLAPLAVDGDPTTIWRTECYINRFAKSGVGLVVGAGEAAELTRLEVDSNAAGWQASVYVADAPKASLAEWGEPVQALDGGPNSAVDLGGRQGGAVLLWVTSVEGIPPDNCFGQRPGSHRLEISEVRLLGR